MTIAEHEVVRITAEIPADRVARDASAGRVPRIGDVGAIVLAHGVGTHREPCFVVECVDPNGLTLWLADVFASELERVSSHTGEP